MRGHPFAPVRPLMRPQRNDGGLGGRNLVLTTIFAGDKPAKPSKRRSAPAGAPLSVALSHLERLDGHQDFCNWWRPVVVACCLEFSWKFFRGGLDGSLIQQVYAIKEVKVLRA